MQSGVAEQSATGIASRRAMKTVPLPARIAVVGCGAMTKVNLLPVLSGHDRLRLTALVDLNEASARTLAETYQVPHAFTSLDALTPDLVDGVIIATPPLLHAPQALELAARGLHLFVEKPMTAAAADAEAMVQAADAAGVVLSVGVYRRLLPSTRLLRALLESGVVGRPLAVDIEEGGEYGWGLATLANLTRRLGGGGVLIDIGPHVLDQLQFLLPGPIRLQSCSDNARGGIETDALLQVVATDGGREIPCRVDLSRTREMRNSILVQCERGSLELPRGEFSRVKIHIDGIDVTDAVLGTRPVAIGAQWGDEAPPIGYQVFRAEIDDWLDAMAGGRDPFLSGRSAVATVRLIEDAYREKTSMVEPWIEEGLTPPTSGAPAVHRSRRRVLITGASGFIGCRAAELLTLRDGVEVRALVRNPSGAARLARLPVEMVPGDICSPEDVTRALEGCDDVVHCAVGTSWKRAEVAQVTVDGTRIVAEAAARAKVRRFVHISSMAVHGSVAAATIDESTPLADPKTHGYPGDKRRAEDCVQQLVREGLRAVILRPARVYGPWGKTFITRPLQHIRRQAFTLTGAIDAPASMVYVDNVVEAMVRALDGDESLIGEAFEISDPEQLSWREFYAFFAEAMGTPLQVSASSNSSPASVAPPGVLKRWQRGVTQIVMSPELRALARKCMDTDPIGALPRRLWETPALRKRIQAALGMTDATIYRPAPAAGAPMLFQAEAAAVVAEKATRVLKFEPIVTRERAMDLTVAWARHMRIF